MLELEWRPRAQLDRESIVIYLGIECGSPEGALKAIKGIDAVIDRVREFPDSGGRFRLDSLERHEYRTVAVGKYTAYYRFGSTMLTVYRVLHQRRDIDSYSFIDL